MAETGGIAVDTALVRELAELLDANHLTEIEVRDGERSIRVARTAAAVTAGYAVPSAMPTGPGAAAAPAAATTTAATAAATAATDWKNHPGVVKSPIVGTAYLTPEPGAPPYVAEGARVEAGDTLVIIEAMKVMNPITAPRAGTVTKVLITSEKPVEYDEPLVVIE